MIAIIRHHDLLWIRQLLVKHAEMCAISYAPQAEASVSWRLNRSDLYATARQRRRRPDRTSGTFIDARCFQSVRPPSNASESKTVLAEIASHFAAGGLCFAALAVLALVTNYGGVRLVFWRTDPLEAFALVLGSLFGFLPLVICLAVGSLRRGEQTSTLHHSDDDHPLR